MNPNYVRKTIGIAMALFGGYWIYFVLVQPIHQIVAGDPKTADYIFAFTMFPVMSLTGFLAVVFGIRFFREMSESTLRWVVGVATTFGGIFLISLLSRLFSKNDTRAESSVTMLAATLIASACYLVVVRRLLIYLGSVRRRHRDFIGRGLLFLIAFELWQAVSGMMNPLEATEGVWMFAWVIATLAVPIIVAVGFFKLALGYLGLEPKPSAPAKPVPLPPMAREDHAGYSRLP